MFKIASGEMVLSEILSETDEAIETQSPMIVHFAPQPDGQLGISLFPLNPMATSLKDKITIKKSHIMFFISFDKGLEKEYMRITSGIIAVEPKVEIPEILLK